MFADFSKVFSQILSEKGIPMKYCAPGHPHVRQVNSVAPYLIESISPFLKDTLKKPR